MGTPNFTFEADGFGLEEGRKQGILQVRRIVSCADLLIASSLTGELRDGAQWAMKFRASICSEVWEYRGIWISGAASGDLRLTGREHSAPFHALKVLHDIG